MTLVELAATVEADDFSKHYLREAEIFIALKGVVDRADKEFVNFCFGWMGAMELVKRHVKELTVEAE